MEEPLLKLNRDYNDKETIAVLNRRIASLTRSYRKIEELNQDLFSRVERLKAHLENVVDKGHATEDILATGQFVKYKTHAKLTRRYIALKIRFWEIVDERDQLESKLKTLNVNQ